MLLLPWIGAREIVEQLGFMIERCPSCETVAVFSVYDTKRKITFALIPTVPVSSQRVLECTTCHTRFGWPPTQTAALAARLLTKEQLTTRLRDLRAQLPPGAAGLGASGANGTPGGRPTYYQVLQVDPSADPEVIEAAFKRLALKYHPDRSSAPDSAARMRDLIAAKAILANPAKRHAYDLTLGIVREPLPTPSRPAAGERSAQTRAEPGATAAPPRPASPPPFRAQGIRPDEV